MGKGEIEHREAVDHIIFTRRKCVTGKRGEVTEKEGERGLQAKK